MASNKRNGEEEASEDRELIEDEKVQKNLLSRLRRGKTDKMMSKLYDYAYGVPKQPVQIEGPDGSDPFATVLATLWRARRGESSAPGS